MFKKNLILVWLGILILSGMFLMGQEAWPPVDLCGGINCGDYGSCVDGYCVCTDGYIGDNCEHPPIPSTNLMISSDDTLYEYTSEGDFVQSFPIPYPVDPIPVTESARDIVFSLDGTVHVYNGTFDPYLSSYNIITEIWTDLTYPGWSTVNNGTYGGIAINGNDVFVTDMTTYGDPEDEEAGIVKINLITGAGVRFATTIEPIDLTIGLDGLLYALYPGGSPEGRDISIFDPATLTEIGHIDLSATFGHTGHRAIAVTADSEVIIADSDGDLQKIDSAGNLLLETNICGHAESCNLYDVNVSQSGLVAIGDRFGGIVITNIYFSNFSSFTVGARGAFVAIVQ